MIRSCPSCGAKNRIPSARAADRATCGRCKSALPPLDTPYEVESASDFDALVRHSSLPVVVDFWAAWCAPCRMVAPEVARLAREQAGRVLVAKVDTEALPQVAGRYGIQGIPAFVLFRDGREASRATGAMPAPQLARALGLG
jgi:thioredoxin 2